MKKIIIFAAVMAAVILVGCKKESDSTGEMTSMLKLWKNLMRQEQK